MSKNGNVIVDILAAIGAGAVGAGAVVVGEKLYDKFKKKYATLEVAERKEEEEP